MPFYVSTTQEGMLSAEQKQTISEEITRIHCAATGAPRSVVRVLFMTYPSGCAFSGGRSGALAVLSCEIRAGRGIAVKQTMLKEFWEMYARVTGAAKDQMLVILTDVPAGQVMEFGAILPEPREEAAWLAVHAA
ncbi:tautomerase family protein [Acidisoma sp. L85]|uniref:tautomerase family protein n=1 Tax=Acidisoma sp. L85 TaxID=1641850 RepID=UPI00131BBA68|nr:tautomerase family protein [Acidisoma sp. L85]